MPIRRVTVTDPWAERELIIRIRSRNLVALLAYAQEQVQHLRVDGGRDRAAALSGNSAPDGPSW